MSKRTYFIGLLILFASAYSQYLVRGLSPISGMLVVYGIPILATGILWGRAIVRRALGHNYNALKFGLGFFGAFTVLGILAASLILYIILTIDPAAVNLLHRPNPVLHVTPEFA